MPAGFSGASALSSQLQQQQQQQQQSAAGAQSAATGVYTFTQDEHAASVGIQYPPADVASFVSVEDCLEACDYSPDCAGFTIQQTVAREAIGTTCMLIKGDTRQGRFLRTVIRTDPDWVGLPGTFLCPSGFDQAAGASVCVPITTVQQVTFALIATGTCDAAAVESARAAVLAYLSDPVVSFGVYRPNLKLTADCVVLSVDPVSSFCWTLIYLPYQLQPEAVRCQTERALDGLHVIDHPGALPDASLQCNFLAACVLFVCAHAAGTALPVSSGNSALCFMSVYCDLFLAGTSRPQAPGSVSIRRASPVELQG
jgi:hypothetical protein